jgi:hypothetical protein
MKLIIAGLHKFPGYTGCLSTISAFATIDFLRMSQIAAAVLAGLVSLVTFIIILPKVPEALAKFPDAHRKGVAAIKQLYAFIRNKNS